MPIVACNPPVLQICKSKLAVEVILAPRMKKNMSHIGTVGECYIIVPK
jgi:hypothetical protein